MSFFDFLFSSKGKSSYSNCSSNRQGKSFSVVSYSEDMFLPVLQKILKGKYSLQFQFPFGAIVNRQAYFDHDIMNYRLDFAVFDRCNRCVLFIEINDSTHNHPSRRERDYKLKCACNKLGIPLVTFWTNKGVDYNYIRSVLSQYLYL